MGKHRSSTTQKSNFSSTIFNQIKNYYPYIFLVVVIAYFFYLCDGVSFIQDDTYITLQYSKNFADGKGLVFNIGEQVEGFTSFAWVIFLGFAYKLGFNIEIISQLFSVMFGAISLIVTYLLFIEIISHEKFQIRDKNLIRVFGILSTMITAISGTFYYWSVSGMETSLFTAFFLITIYLYLKFYRYNKLNILLPIIIFITSLIRPEGNLLLPLIILHSFYVALKENGYSLKEAVKKITTKKRLQEYVLFAILLGVLSTFRLLYFGYPLPNTFYAKTSFSIDQIKTGLDYFLSFASDYLFYGFLLAASIYLIRYKEKIINISFVYLTIAVYVIYIILIGGDVLTQYRFFVPILPLIFILFCGICYHLSTTLVPKERKASLPMLLIIPFSVAIFINIINAKITNDIALKESSFVDNMKSTGIWIKEQAKIKNKQITIAASTIGALAYFSDENVLDMLGLTNSYIAHYTESIEDISDEFVGWKERKYNARYVLDRKPDFILFSTQEKPSSYAERALFIKKDFHANYYIYLYNPDDSKVYGSIYKRKEDRVTFLKDSINHNSNYSIKYISQYNKVLNLISSSNNKFNIDDFILECKELIKISPSYFGDPYRLLAWGYAQNEDTLNAKENAKNAINIDGVNLKASILLISIYLNDNDFTNAELEINRIESIVPDIAERLKKGMLSKKQASIN